LQWNSNAQKGKKAYNSFMETLNIFMEYLMRIWPGPALTVLLFLIVRPPAFGRVLIYIGLFILFRDALTPLGLWSFGSEGGFWIRMSNNPLFLAGYGLMALFAMAILLALDRENRGLFRWFSNDRLFGFLASVLAAVVVVAPLAFLYRNVDIGARGGTVALSLLPPLFLFAMLGNFVEEGLFRGFLLGHLKEYLPTLQAGIASGVIFAFCHLFLALTVTDIGLPIIIFTLWEGLIAGLIGARYGVIPATITHGGAIFLLSSGLL
jgi:uncharacterized protein